MSKEKIDILEDVKNIEKKAKAKLLIETTIELKKKIKEITKLKLECDIALEEIGVSKEDSKRIIDFLKELPESKVDKDKVKEMKKNKKKEVTEIKNNFIKDFNSNSQYWNNTTGGNMFYTATDTVNLCSSNGNSLEVKL
jgi:hypothetical protein